MTPRGRVPTSLMIRTTKLIAWMAATAAAVALPALASGDPGRALASIVAVDYAFQTADGGEGAVTVNAGETVTFSYPAGSSFHNVVFTGAAPTSCTQSSGTNLGGVPPLPALPHPPGWSGSCRFDVPGTYAFVCGAHGFMEGTVTVEAVGTPTASASPSPTASATASPTASATASPTASATASPTASATASPAASATASPAASQSPPP